jgi:hypothetical protein
MCGKFLAPLLWQQMVFIADLAGVSHNGGHQGKTLDHQRLNYRPETERGAEKTLTQGHKRRKTGKNAPRPDPSHPLDERKPGFLRLIPFTTAENTPWASIISP